MTLAQPGPDLVVSPHDGWVAPKGLAPDGRRLAGRGRRFVGLLVDGCVALIPTLFAVAVALVVAALTLGPDAALTGGGAAALVLAYLSLLAVSLARVAFDAELVHRHGATLGMGWLGLTAVDARTGGPVRRGKAWGRALLAAVASGQLAGLGYLVAFVDPRRRTLHDLACGTVVLDAGDRGRPPAPAFGGSGGGGGGARRWPPRRALPTVVGLAAAAILACAVGGGTLAVAHSNVKAPINATRDFFALVGAGATPSSPAGCEVGGDLAGRLTRGGWDGGLHLLESDVRPFTLSETEATVTGALSTSATPGGIQDYEPLIVELRKAEGRWRVCEVDVL